MGSNRPTYTWLHWKYWRDLFLNSFLVSALAVSLIIVVALVGEDFWDKPPVNVIRISPEDLGVVCPGQSMPVRNLIEIEDSVIAIYYIGMMDSQGVFNIVGNQEIFSGYQHPMPGTFEQTLPWQVPDLEPGVYVRSFAARGTDTSEKTVFITSTLTIGSDCNVVTNISDRREDESRGEID